MLMRNEAPKVQKIKAMGNRKKRQKHYTEMTVCGLLALAIAHAANFFAYCPCTFPESHSNPCDYLYNYYIT